MIFKFLGAKRTEFRLQTDHFLGLKPYITSPALTTSTKEYKIKLNGYTPETTTLRATSPEYKSLHLKNKQFQLNGCHTIHMGGSYDHAYLNALKHLQLVIPNLHQICCLRSNYIYFIWIHMTKKNIRVEYV